MKLAPAWMPTDEVGTVQVVEVMHDSRGKMDRLFQILRCRLY